MCFADHCRKNMEEVRTIRVTEQAKKIGELWRELDDNEKQPFIQEAEADKERYLREMEEYKNSPEYLEFQEKLKEAEGGNVVEKKAGGEKKGKKKKVAVEDLEEEEEMEDSSEIENQKEGENAAVKQKKKATSKKRKVEDVN